MVRRSAGRRSGLLSVVKLLASAASRSLEKGPALSSPMVGEEAPLPRPPRGRNLAGARYRRGPHATASILRAGGKLAVDFRCAGPYIACLPVRTEVG